MADAVWSNVGIDVQTALSTANPITAISKAATAVVTYSGTDPANGDVVIITAYGMQQINRVVARIANVNAASNTCELEGVDSSTFDTFTSGSMQVVALGASFITTQTVNASGGDVEYADFSTVHAAVKRRKPSSVSPMTMQLSCLYNLADPAQAELRRATKTMSTRVVRFRFASGEIFLFSANPSATGVPTGATGQAVQTPISLEAETLPTAYAS